MIVGITSSIAMGKSTLAKRLRLDGYNVIDADDIAHDIMDEDIDVIMKIKDHFPSVIINDKIDRKSLGKIVFKDADKRKILEDITHPVIIKKLKALVKDKDLVFIVVPLLYETGLDSLTDKVITIYTSNEVQLKRLMLRDKISEKEAMAKINASFNIEEKKRRANFLIDNNYDFDYTYTQAIKIINEIKMEVLK